MASAWRLHGTHPQRREACGLARRAVGQVRAGHQRSDGPDARPHSARHAARPRRRGDRMIRRREFITLLGGAAAATWPLGARAQQGGKLPRLGILSPGRSELPEPGVIMLDAFVQGLHELGYAEGRNLILERRYAEWRPERLRELAAELAGAGVDVIVAFATPAARAAKQATSAIPIVAVAVGDPVADGLVDSLAKPGGNVTGTSFL